MKRRDFVKDIALAGAGLLFMPAWKGLHAGENRQFSSDAAQAAVPSLDDLAGDWISGEAFEQTPAICNFHGGIQAGRNVLSINSFVRFPLTQGGELAQLSVDGAEIAAQEYRWYAYQMLRRAQTQELQIVTTVRMPFEASGVLFRVDVTNLSKQMRTANLTIALGSAIREYSGTWHWDPPRPDKSNWQEFHHIVVQSEHGEMLLTQDTRSKSTVAFAFLQQPDKLSGQSHDAQWNLALQPGESRQIKFVMAAGTSSAQTLSQISEWRTNFDQAFDRAKEEWQKRFLMCSSPITAIFRGISQHL